MDSEGDCEIFRWSNGGALHQTGKGRIPGVTLVHHACVVPQDTVANIPFVLVDEFRLEGQGGHGPGSIGNHECYQNAIYFFARHTATDCFEKRKQKGFLFLCGDEMPYDEVNAQHVKDIIGDGLESDISTETIIKEAQAKYEVFFIVPAGSYNANNDTIPNAWRKLLGNDHVLKLGDVGSICETVAGVVGLTLGTTTLAKFTESLTPQKAGIVREALTPLATKVGKVGDAKPLPTVARL